MCPIITHLFNRSLSDGYFPNILKKFKIIPLYKSVDRKKPENYRPISLLPQLSKILERLIKNQILNFINKHNIINECQYGFMKRRFKSGINVAKTRVYNKADIGSDHDLVMISFKQKFKSQRKQKSIHKNYNIEQLNNNSSILAQYRDTIENEIKNKLMHNTINSDETTDILNRIISETATKVIGFKRKKTKPWITEDILELCDKRRSLKSQKSNHLQEYNSLNKRIRKNMKKAKEYWLNNECKDIDNSFASNRSKKAYSIIKALTKKKSEAINTILSKDGKVLSEDTHIIKRWTEYCQELNNYESRGDKKHFRRILEGIRCKIEKTTNNTTINRRWSLFYLNLENQRR